MTDSTGVFQHAVFSVPNFSEGYCTDDNARAFILAVLLGELGEDPEPVRALATTSAAFLHHAFDRQDETLPQPPEFRPALAGRTGIGGLSREGALGAGHRRGTFAIRAASR